MVVKHFPHELKTAIAFDLVTVFEMESGIPSGCEDKVINPTMLDPRSNSRIL
jgi:hypothetical protein